MGKKTIAALIFGAMTLAGCDTARDSAEQPTDIISRAVQTVRSQLSANQPPVDFRHLLTREAIDAETGPVMLAHVEDRDAYAVLSLAGQNRGILTWRATDGITLSLQHDIAIASRGLGQDIMSGDISTAYPALLHGSGDAVRIHDYLDGEWQIERRSFYCTYAVQNTESIDIYGINVNTRHVTEACNNPEFSFENEYWIGQGQRIWQSRQWISPTVGYVMLQHLSRS
ncbi:YjbF family lipoprotein [Cochlodiniinecator piscidefendens]|uniref:YjbF family lipoprotein n=1 Tax=Cochlodiniinecator piscidefendens TaxID=2715756 RepID=UPI00140C2670|nr:YjbF family lipoprotein [Cochlodiniinecator piscidefendens]